MKRAYLRDLFAAGLIVLAFLAAWTRAQSSDADIAATVDRYLGVRAEMGGFSGAVLIARDNKIIFRKGYGYADVEKRVPYTPETKHEVASLSKMFTDIAVLQLRDDGKLKIDDPICKYIDRCPDTWQPIVIQQLMRHTSGIPDYESALEIGSPKYMAFMTRTGASTEIVENAKKLPLDFKPGEKFNYSNTGYIILSDIVQKASGKPFARYVTDEILRPAGMKNSGVIDHSDLPSGLAKGYTYGDVGWDKTLAGVPFTDRAEVPQLSLESPEGDAWLFSTLDDLYKWSQIMDGSKLVSDAEAKEIFTPGLENYGYGWFIGNAFDRKRYRHTGALPGYISDFVKFPDDHITIILFSNLDRGRMSSVTRDVSSIVLGKPYDMPVRGTVIKLTPDQISRLEGDYKTADGKLLTIKNAPDYLTARLQDRYTAGLIPLSPTEFYFPLGDGKAIFTLNDGGKAVRVNMRYSGEDHIAERTP